MNENGTTEAKKANELVSIFVEAFPQWQGDRITTDKRVGDGEHKYTVSLPSPKDADEFEELYGPHFTLTLAVDKGVTQRAYDDGNAVKNLCDEAVLTQGEDPNSDEMIDRVRETMEEAMCREATKRAGGAAKAERAAGKAAKNAAAELGMSLEEMIALAKQAAAEKGE